MKHFFSLALMALALVALAACGDKQPEAQSGGHHEGDGHDHEEGDHEGHDHEEGEHDEHDHGARVELGTAKAGQYSVTTAVFGEIELGHEAVLDIEVADGAVSVLRCWVGVESGKGSLKAKLDGEDGDYHGHLEVPGTLPADSMIWVEVEDAAGARSRCSFKLPN